MERSVYSLWTPVKIKTSSQLFFISFDGLKAQRGGLQPVGLPPQVLLSNPAAAQDPRLLRAGGADKSRMVTGELGEVGAHRCGCLGIWEHLNDLLFPVGETEFKWLTGTFKLFGCFQLSASLETVSACFH